MSSPPGGPSASAATGSLFGSALTTLSGLNSALWTRLETSGEMSDDCMSLSSLTLEESPGINRMGSTDSRDIEALDADIAEQSRRAAASATPTPTARPPRMVAVSKNISSETIPESFDATTAAAGGVECPSVDSFVNMADVRKGGTAVAYCFFSRDDDAVVQTQATDGRLLRNYSPVFAKPVMCSSVVWTPILGNNGEVGHCFFLEHGGGQQARIEAFFGDDAAASCEPTRIAVVNRLSTPMAVEAMLVDRGSMLEFSPPSRHAAKLNKLLNTMEASNDVNSLYSPVKEIVLGPAFNKDRFRGLLQLPPHLQGHAHSTHAARAWEKTITALRQVSDETRRGVNFHNKRELANLV